MTLYEYKLLERDEQFNVLWAHGKVIDVRFKENEKFVLYKLDSFYVELRYDHEENRIEGLKSFTSELQLIPYLKMN